MIDRLIGWLWGLIACAVITWLTGCTTPRQLVTESLKTRTEWKTTERHDTVRDTVVERDYVYMKDSMAMSVRGDTVYVDRWHRTELVRIERRGHTATSACVDSTRTDRDTVSVVREAALPASKKTGRSHWWLWAILSCLAGVGAAVATERFV